MTQLTPEQVRHIAKLARLRLSAAEEEKFSKELSGILQYVEKLSEVNTDNVEPTAQVTGLTNRFRADEIRTDTPAPEALLGTSPLPVEDRQIVTPSAHG
jgi:aspartyl-tRNA(Asn)/glutamyl-tRNA(Gln) amidotransferase subunit C